MRKELRIGLICFASFALAAVLCAFVPTASNATAATTITQTPAAPQSVSGKITSIEKSSFTLSVGPEQKSAIGQTERATPKSMTFQVDSNTTIDGKLKVGANAEVTYRQDGANNIAISVRVS